MLELVVSDRHDEIRSEISKLLSAATKQSGQTFSPSSLSLAWFDSGKLVGGLAGSTNWDWLYIETLAVAPAYRNQGLAKKLVSEAEDIARERGCVGSWVDTFTFQVPDFYTRLGYVKFGELPQYPAEHSRIFLRKLFRDESS